MKRFIVYGIIVFGLLFYSTYYTINLSICLAAIAGMVTWMFAEYLFHRFAFHSAQKYPMLAYDHLNHHKYPDDSGDFILPLQLTLPVSAVLFLLVYSGFGFVAAAFYYTGMFIGYFFYEFVHYQAHHKSYNVRYLRYLKKRHGIHHHVDNLKNFGVTSPILDWLFKTSY